MEPIVTILKTLDGARHHIHFLMDHYSKMILGWRIEASSSGMTIKSLLQNAFEKYRPEIDVKFLTDGGPENDNNTVADFLQQPEVTIQHLVAQRGIAFSNSATEAFNKVIKHQFLLPQGLACHSQLCDALDQSIPIYNTVRPQLALGGNSPNESFKGVPHNFHRSLRTSKSKKQCASKRTRRMPAKAARNSKNEVKMI